MIDLRRLEVAARRFESRIADGLSAALTENREIDDGTARVIAHVLGRAYGRASNLAEFGRTGEGTYSALREEYLQLYSLDAPADIREWIDWFGTYLVDRENIGSSRRFMNEHLPPQLEQLLVRTEVSVDEEQFTVHIPAHYDNAAIAELTETLTVLNLPQNQALQAFLQLQDVNALSGDIMESFHESFAGSYSDMENLVRALSPLEDWESDLADWRDNHGIEPDALKWNIDLLGEHLRQIYDLVDWKGRLYAFSR